MRLNSRALIVVLLLWIPVVGLLFATIPEKKVASVVAGTGFLILPLLVLFAEFTKVEKSKVVIFFTTVFFLFSALPIFLLRVLNWSRDFSELSLLGVPADFLHRSANILYLLMVVAVGAEIFRARKAKSCQK